MTLVIYILSIVGSLFYLYLIADRDSEYPPLVLLILLLVPIVNIIIFVWILFLYYGDELLSNEVSKSLFDKLHKKD